MILKLVDWVVTGLIACLLLLFSSFLRVIKLIFTIDDDYLNLFIVVSSALDWHYNLLFVVKLSDHFVQSLLILLFFRLKFLRLDFFYL